MAFDAHGVEGREDLLRAVLTLRRIRQIADRDGFERDSRFFANRLGEFNGTIDVRRFGLRITEHANVRRSLWEESVPELPLDGVFPHDDGVECPCFQVRYGLDADAERVNANRLELSSGFACCFGWVEL